MTVNKNGNTWQASIKIDGITRRIGIGGRGMPKAFAQAKADKIQASVDAAVDIRARPPLSDCVDLWLSSREWSPRTLTGHRAVLRSLVSSLGDPRGVTVTPTELVRWRSSIIGCEATRCRYSRVVKAMFAWMVKADLVQKNFALILKSTFPPAPPEERYVPSDMVSLIESTEPRLRQCISLLAYTGLRLGEAQRLSWDDILTDRIKVRTERGVEGSKQKYRVTRLDPVLRELFAAADKTLPPHGLRSGATARDIQRAIATTAIAINEPLTANACRRWRAVSWHQIYPSHVVCSWLGHTEAVARSHYLKPTEEYYQ